MIHNSSIIDKKAILGKNVKVGPFCYIGPNVQISDDVELISNVHIEGNTKIGEGTKIFPFSSLGTQPQDLKYKGEFNSLERKMNRVASCVDTVENDPKYYPLDIKNPDNPTYKNFQDSPYITNDERAKLKNNISLLFNSDILEVKSYKEY